MQRRTQRQDLRGLITSTLINRELSACLYVTACEVLKKVF